MYQAWIHVAPNGAPEYFSCDELYKHLAPNGANTRCLTAMCGRAAFNSQPLSFSVSEAAVAPASFLLILNTVPPPSRLLHSTSASIMLARARMLATPRPGFFFISLRSKP